MGGGPNKGADGSPPEDWEDFRFTSGKQVSTKDRLGDRQCCSFPARERLLSFDVRRIGFDARSVEYRDLDITGNNKYLKILCRGRSTNMLELWGRNLERLKHYFRQHRISWLRQAKDDCYDDYQLFIGDINFEDASERFKPLNIRI